MKEKLDTTAGGRAQLLREIRASQATMLARRGGVPIDLNSDFVAAVRTAQEEYRRSDDSPLTDYESVL